MNEEKEKNAVFLFPGKLRAEFQMDPDSLAPTFRDFVQSPGVRSEVTFRRSLPLRGKGSRCIRGGWRGFPVARLIAWCFQKWVRIIIFLSLTHIIMTDNLCP